MNCHYGYSDQHLVYAGLHFGVLVYVLMARLPLWLRASFCASAAVNVMYHLIMVCLCSSTFLSATLPEIFPIHPRGRFRMLQHAFVPYPLVAFYLIKRQMARGSCSR